MGGKHLRLGISAAFAVLLAACAQTPAPVVTTPPGPTTPVTPPGPATPPSAENPVPAAMRLSTLPGWDTADAFIAFEAVKATCGYKKGRQYGDICKLMLAQDFNAPDDIKAFLNSHFQVVPLDGSGLLTGYFVPDYDATRAPTDEFSQPVRTRPADLVTIPGAQLTPAQPNVAKIAARKVGDTYVPYYTREDIEKQPNTADYWMRPEDYFFMQLQGSGFLDLPGGARVYAAYAADNGQPFVGIAKVMVDRGLLASNQTSGDNIHNWLAAHRGPDATAVMNANPRYAFFAIQPNQTEPLGAAAVPLPPGSAIAVDPTQHDLGDLFWIDASAGTLSQAFPVYQRMVAALDTGGAIKGNIRADLYVGHGERAGTEAGRIKHTLHMYRIMPYVAGN